MNEDQSSPATPSAGTSIKPDSKPEQPTNDTNPTDAPTQDAHVASENAKPAVVSQENSNVESDKPTDTNGESDATAQNTEQSDPKPQEELKPAPPPENTPVEEVKQAPTPESKPPEQPASTPPPPSSSPEPQKVQPAPAEPVATTPQVQSTPQAQPAAMSASQHANNSSKKKIRKFILILLGLLLIGVAAAAVYVFLFSADENLPPLTDVSETNVSYKTFEGWVAEEEDGFKIYHAAEADYVVDGEDRYYALELFGSSALGVEIQSFPAEAQEEIRNELDARFLSEDGKSLLGGLTDDGCDSNITIADFEPAEVPNDFSSYRTSFTCQKVFEEGSPEQLVRGEFVVAVSVRGTIELLGYLTTDDIYRTNMASFDELIVSLTY